MLASLAEGTMAITEPRRNIVLTYPRSWDPTENSSPMSARFIIVLIRGVMNAPETVHAKRCFLSESVYAESPMIHTKRILS